MLRKLLIGGAFAGLAVAAVFTSAQAQDVELRVGPEPRYERYYESAQRYQYRETIDRPRGYVPVIQRRLGAQPIIEDDEDDCRIVERERINRFGEVVTRRYRVCD